MKNAKKLTKLEEYWRQLDEAPSLEKYLEFRRETRGGDIIPEQLLTFEHLFTVAEELRTTGIDPMLVAGVHDGDERALDDLMLLLIEKLVERKAKVRAGATHVQRRGKGIRDSLVDFLALTALQACSSSDIVPPTSLIFVLTERLGGFAPDIHSRHILARRKSSAAMLAAQMFSPGKTISKRKIAKELGVQPSTVSRWFRPGELEKQVEGIHASFVNPHLLKRLRQS